MSRYAVCFVVCLAMAAAKAEDLDDATEARVLQDMLGRLQLEDVTLPLPWDTQATVSSRGLQNGVLHFNLKFKDTDTNVDEEGRGKKKKIKKIAAPIIVLLILKAITLIPLLLGVLGIKTWNALQLSFVTFMTSFGLAVYELLKKFASDHPTPIITHIAHDHHHDHHDHHWQKRSVDGQRMAYNAYN